MEKNYADIATAISTQIISNNSNYITGPILQDILIDIAASYVNTIDGGEVDAVIKYSSDLSAGYDDRTLIDKGYLESYVASMLTSVWINKGTIDCSSNPNYPAASTGWSYTVSVSGKIGGASGVTVTVGDVILCIADNAGGTQASVGSSWDILQYNLDQATESVYGYAKIATLAQTNTGSDDATIITPAKISGSKYLDQGGSKVYAVASGTDTYTASLTPAITAYSSGQSFKIKFSNANTGVSSLNINSIGAISIKKNVNEDLSANDIKANQVINVVYDGTNFQITGGGSSLSNIPGITAYAGGGQANATVLTKTYNRIDNVANNNDSCKNDPAISGTPRYIQNATANDLELFPAIGENFLGLATNEPIVIVGGNKINLYCYETGVWTII